MKEYLIIGASEFVYKGNVTTKQDGLRVVIPGELEGYYIYLQDVKTLGAYKLVLTEDVVIHQLEPELNREHLYSRTPCIRYDYYGYWKLEECDYSILNDLHYVPHEESYISLPSTQEELLNISHDLFSVWYEHDEGYISYHKDGRVLFHDNKWKYIRVNISS